MEILILYLVLAGLQAVSAAGKCTYTRQYKMMGANCFGQELEEIPRNLNQDIEFLYAAKNRIRSLSNSSLRDYSALRFLYLGDNFITKVEAAAFSELSSLEVLDLSRNAMRSLPSDLPLPLRTLYLNDNVELQNLSLSAAFNLANLSLANCELRRFPSLGTLPNLKELNMSGNPLSDVSPADLAPLCRLEKLYLPASLYKGSNSKCQCHRLLAWTTQRYISLPAFNCTPLEDPDSAACDVDLSEEMRVYKVCLATMPASTTRHLLLAVLACALILAAVVVICWWRKGRRKKNSVQDQKRTDKNTKAADTLIT